MTHPAAQPRVTLPFSPYFLDQVQAGQVSSITTKSDTINGTLKTAVRYPASTATATTLFVTQIPAFWNSNELVSELRSQNVQVNAKNPHPGTSELADILLGFGPTLLFVGLFWFLARRAQSGAGGLGGLGSFGRSQARRVDPERIRVTFDDVDGIDDAKGRADRPRQKYRRCEDCPPREALSERRRRPPRYRSPRESFAEP